MNSKLPDELCAAAKETQIITTCAYKLIMSDMIDTARILLECTITTRMSAITHC